MHHFDVTSYLTQASFSSFLYNCNLFDSIRHEHYDSFEIKTFIRECMACCLVNE